MSNNVKQKRNCLLIMAFVDIKFDMFLIIEVSFYLFGCQKKHNKFLSIDLKKKLR